MKVSHPFLSCVEVEICSIESQRREKAGQRQAFAIFLAWPLQV